MRLAQRKQLQENGECLRGKKRRANKNRESIVYDEKWLAYFVDLDDEVCH